MSMNPHRGLLHHLNIVVSDVVRASRFYGPVLAYLGYERTGFSHEGEWPYEDWKPWKLEAPHELSISQAPKGMATESSPGRVPGSFTHLAFCAADREDVDRFYREVLVPLGQAGLCTVENAPGECPEYAPGYYATFFFDPDGIKYEFVFTPGYGERKRLRESGTGAKP
jgi:glyoxylase I family protein